jgi:hypothetical protein
MSGRFFCGCERKAAALPFLGKIPSVSARYRIRAQTVCFAHLLAFEPEDLVLDGTADEVRALAFRRGRDTVNSL